MAELDQIYKSLYILFVGMARQVAKKNVGRSLVECDTRVCTTCILRA